MKKLLVTTTVVLLSLVSWAQQNLTGKVTDSETGEALVGVNVYIPDARTGTITDQQGSFTLKVQSNIGAIEFSYVGYGKKVVEYTGQTSLSIQLKPEANLEEVIIQAFRVSDEAPVAQTTINKKGLDKVYVGQDAPFVLEKIAPSIISYSEAGTNFSNYGQFRLRGIDQTRVNITLNGAPLNDMIDQGVFFSNFTDLTNNVESVQIQRGVGTSANGTASFAGSVGFESTSISQEDPSAQVELVGGSFNTYRASASVSSGIMDNKWAFSTRFTTATSDGYRYNTDSKSRSFYGSAGYFGEKDFVKVTGFIGRSQNGLGYLPVAISDINADPRTNYLNENDRDDFSQWFIQTLHTHVFNDNLSLASNLYYGGAGGDYFFTYDNGAGGFDQINYPLRNDHLGVMSNLNYTSQDSKLNLYGGIHAYTFRRKNWEQFMPDKANPYYTEESKKDEFSFFAKADYSLGKLKIYGDVQFRTLSLDIEPDQVLLPGQGTVTKSWNFLNPKLGLSYQLNQNNSLYVSYGRNGREPTKVDLFGGFQLNSSNLPQVEADSVRPEFVNDFEGGINFSYPWLTGQVNLFYMKFTDEIAPIGEYVPEGFLQLRKNMPSSYRAGAEMALRVRGSGNAYFDVNATYINARIESYSPAGDQTYTDVKAPLTPQFMGAGTINYAFAERFTISVTGRYSGESYLEPTNNEAFIMPSFFVADLGFSARFWKSSHFDIFLNNIFDKQYFTYGAPVDLNFDGTFDEPGYFVQPPRNFYAKLVIGF